MKHFLISLLFLMSNAFSQDIKTYIPERAYQHLPTLKEEIVKFAPEIQTPWYFAGLIEHESCIGLKHSKCWNTMSQLKNSREQGLGLFQMTRSWDAKGNLRFDNLTTLSIKYRTHLGEMTWSNYSQRPDLQIRSGILLWMEGYNALPGMSTDLERIAASSSAFNGGLSHVRKAREICALKANCNPKLWFNNTEYYLPKSRTPDPRYGGQSMYSINVKHPRDIIFNRMDKYKRFWN